MEVKDLGRVVPILRGVYDPNQEYETLDLVFYDEATYAAKEDVKGEDPDISGKWQLVVRGFISETQINQIVRDLMGEVDAAGYVQDNNYVHTDNNFEDKYKEFIDNYEPPVGTVFEGLGIQATTGSFIFTLVTNGMRYSFDKEEWFDMPYGYMVNIEEGTTIYLWASTKQSVNAKFSIVPSSGDNLITVSGIVDSFHFPSYHDVSHRGNEYNSLFGRVGCELDISELVLPCTNLANNSYASMFIGNRMHSGVIPELPATELPEYCYANMYQECQGIDISDFVFNGRILNSHCYCFMFYDASFLDGDLSNVVIHGDTFNSEGQFESMFRYTNITHVPQFNVSRVNVNWEFHETFAECYYLTDVVPMTITNDCGHYVFYSMYTNCPGITDASSIVMTGTGEMGEALCHNMFDGCTSLQVAPVITFQKAHYNSCNAMFKNCSSLQAVECHVTQVNDRDQCGFDEWLDGVAQGGTLTIAEGASWYTDSPSGIPEGWTTQEVQLPPIPEPVPVRITCTDGTVEVQVLTEWRSHNAYRVNGGDWNYFNQWETQYITLQQDDYVEFANKVEEWWDSEERWHIYTTGEGHCTVSGDIMTIGKNMYMNSSPYTGNGGIFSQTFANCANLTDASGLILSHCQESYFIEMFSNCTSLVHPPTVTFTQGRGGGTFHRMFQYCSALTEVMDLSNLTATWDEGYTPFESTYSNCTSLTDIDGAIPIAASPEGGFALQSTFFGCSGITAVPSDWFGDYRPVRADSAFAYCSSLAYVRDLELAKIDHSSWLLDVAQSGTFVMTRKNIINPETMRGSNGIPEGWTIVYDEDIE
jgi:hypothetical protein